jgi:hypothetical protein
MWYNLKNVMELPSDTRSEGYTKYITGISDRSSIQLPRGVLVESAQKNFTLFIKHCRLKEQVSIRGKRKKRNRINLELSKTFSEFNLKKVQFFIQKSADIYLILVKKHF